MRATKKNQSAGKKALKHVLDSYRSFFDTFEELKKSHKDHIRKEIEKHAKRV